MKFAYADPPYIGQAHRYKENTEVDHIELIARLISEYEAWALSASSPSLRIILPLCPAKTRVMAWVKRYATFKPNVPVAYAWEPILVCGGRKRSKSEAHVRDWVEVGTGSLHKVDNVYAKPDTFSFWLFEVLGAEPDDEFHDLFPGTGAVTKAWEIWRARRRLFVEKQQNIPQQGTMLMETS